MQAPEARLLGTEITPLGVFFLYDRHPDVLGIRSMADSTCQGRTQSLGFLQVTMGDPKEQKVLEQRSDRHSGQRGRPSHKTRHERLFQKQPNAGLSANQAKVGPLCKHHSSLFITPVRQRWPDTVILTHTHARTHTHTLTYMYVISKKLDGQRPPTQPHSWMDNTPHPMQKRQ